MLQSNAKYVWEIFFPILSLFRIDELYKGTEENILLIRKKVGMV